MQPSSNNTSHEFDRILSIVCETAVRLAHVEHSYIAIFDSQFKSGTVRAEFPGSVGMVGETVSAEEGFVEPHLVRTINPIVIEDVEEHQTLAGANTRTINPAIKSTVIVPIVVDEAVRGSFAFNVLSNKHEFSHEDIEHFTSLGQVAAFIFKNAYLLEETRAQTEKLEALRKAMLAITREHKREPLLRTIIEQAIKLLPAEGGGIYKYKRRQNVLELVEDYKWPNQVGATLKPGEGLSGRLFVSNKEYMAIPDYKNWEFKADVIKEDVGSALAVPLLWQNRRTGVLFVNGERGREFSEEEAGLLQRFAAMASIALEHSRLRERDRYMVQRLQSLAFATNDIMSRIDDTDMDGQLTQIARYAHEILNAEACGIHQVKRPGYLTLVASDGHPQGDFPKGREFEIISGPGTGLTGHIAHERKPFRKCGKELSNHFAVANRQEASGCHSLLAIPLVKKSPASEEVTGLIRISNKRGRRGVSQPWVCFTSADQSVAEVFAQAAAVVLTKTELLDQIRKGIERYENLLQACNIIVKAVNLEKALSELAIMLGRLLDKSFCRIFLIDESEKLLYTMAAEPREPKQFRWQPLLHQMARIPEWHNLDRALETGQWSVLSFAGDDDRDNLIRLSAKLSISDLQNNPLMVRFLLSIPLKIGRRKVGLINVGELEGADKKGFSQSQVDLALAIASQATVLIDRKWHEELLSRRAKLDAAMIQSLRHIRQTQGVDDLFRVIVKTMVSLFSLHGAGSRMVAGMVIEDSGRRSGLRLIDSVNGPRELETPSLTNLEGTLGSVARTDRSEIVFDINNDNQEEPFLTEYALKILLATPITISSELRCIFFVGDKTTWSSLRRGDLEILERFGQQSAISLAKAVGQQQATNTRAGNYLVAEAMAVDKLEVMLGKAVDGILKSMGCDTVTLYVLDSKKGQLNFPPELAGVKDKAAALKVLDDEKESVIKRVDAIDRYHDAEDTVNDDLLKGKFVLSEGIVSSAGIPIIAQGNKIGVMFVNYRRRHHFDENDKENIKFLAHQAAVAIRNVQMYNEMETKRIHLDALYKTEQAIASSLDLKSALEIVAEQVWKVACANSRTDNIISINLIENNKAWVVAAYPKEELAHIQRELKGEIDLVKSKRIGLVGVAFQAKRSQIFTDLKRNRKSHHIRLHDETQSELVRLIWDSESTEEAARDHSRIVGAITVENSDQDAFDQDDLNVIETLARQAGVVIANDKRSLQVQVLNQDNARLQVMSMMGVATSIWRHKFYHLVEKIFITAKKSLERKPGRWTRANHTDELREITASAAKLMQMLVEVPLSAEDGCRNEPVNAMIKEHLKDLKDDDNNRQVSIKDKLSASGQVSVKVNKNWFVAALSFFTQNSLRSINNSSKKHLLVRTQIVDDAWCRIEISDTGTGMDDDVWSKLFDERKKNKNRTGLGVGLLNARMIIELYGGTVHKVTNSTHGVIVGFSLPIFPFDGEQTVQQSQPEEPNDLHFSIDSNGGEA